MCLIQPSDPPCHVCSQALSVPPEQNPNYRCNTSLLIDYCQSDEKHSYILIDVGKTFREQVLRWFTFHKIPRVDSVMHGEDYISLGFLFGEKSRVAYISDVSRFPASTEYVISNAGAGQLDLLILDTLYKTLEAVKRLCPKRALLIGMTHEFDHYKDNDFLMEWSKREGIPVQLAHDGMRVPIEL
ncbi:hypothetical protein GH714_005740 [Hevea brasiliensis]|uniref:Metallo-beta-lactamase domain-containing protein n=1 Tax=Hevea brasiliensis TaxID=3981 RepID=A0A6A6NFP8_HEVBR|nr:hypothetical protein GH714_005740 [Hevea brasiliensis]